MTKGAEPGRCGLDSTSLTGRPMTVHECRVVATAPGLADVYPLAVNSRTSVGEGASSPGLAGGEPQAVSTSASPTPVNAQAAIFDDGRRFMSRGAQPQMTRSGLACSRGGVADAVETVSACKDFERAV
jgi:hypothetical protein